MTRNISVLLSLIFCSLYSIAGEVKTTQNIATHTSVCTDQEVHIYGAEEIPEYQSVVQAGTQQNAGVSTRRNVASRDITFAGVDFGKLPYAQLLANPTMQTTRAGCVLAGFVLSILPKMCDIYGPYTLNGSKVTGIPLQHIKEKVRIFDQIMIENIRLSCDGIETTQDYSIVVYVTK
jgi:hypothetical protein